MRNTLAIPLTVLLLGVGAPLAAPAQDEGVRIEIDEMTCREMLKMGGEARDFTMIFLHGFLSGRKNELAFDAPALTAATDKVLDGCIDDPDASLLSVFEAARG